MDTAILSIKRLIANVPLIGFTGSRHLTPVSLVKELLANYKGDIWVGDQVGVDRTVSDIFPTAKIWVAENRTAQGYAKRSISFVTALSSQPRKVLIGFPDKPCPSPLKPSPDSRKCFAGYGSGTWASLALGIGLNCNAIIHTQTPPDWDLLPIAEDWYGYFIL